MTEEQELQFRVLGLFLRPGKSIYDFFEIKHKDISEKEANNGMFYDLDIKEIDRILSTMPRCIAEREEKGERYLSLTKAGKSYYNKLKLDLASTDVIEGISNYDKNLERQLKEKQLFMFKWQFPTMLITIGCTIISICIAVFQYKINDRKEQTDFQGKDSIASLKQRIEVIENQIRTIHQTNIADTIKSK